jgi:hypothetical protein
LFFVYFLLCSSIYYFRGAPKSPKSKEAIPKEAIPKEAIPKEAIPKEAMNFFLSSKRKQLLPLGIS